MISNSVTVSVAKGVKPGTTFTVRFQTASADEVYNGLKDSWVYTVK